MEGGRTIWRRGKVSWAIILRVQAFAVSSTRLAKVQRASEEGGSVVNRGSSLWFGVVQAVDGIYRISREPRCKGEPLLTWAAGSGAIIRPHPHSHPHPP